MTKKLILLIATLSFVLGTAGCSFFKKDDAAESADATAEMADESFGEEGDIAIEEGDGAAFDEGDFGGDEFATGEGFDDMASIEAEADPMAAGGDGAPAQDPFASDAAAAPAGDESAMAGDAAAVAPVDDPFAEDTAVTETAPESGTDLYGSESTDSYADAAPYDSSAESSTDTSMLGSGEMTDSSLVSDEMSGLSEEPPPAPKYVPLRKAEATPWRQSGVLLNAIYVAREGDDFETLSTKIYGSTDRVEELRKVNPTIARRTMKVGDKVYYNSPRRPDDETQVLTFYEDLGLTPQVYISQAGDNIRTVATSLLGHRNSWKEIWATNFDVESKGDLPEGTRLRYWPADVATPPAMPEMADTPPMGNDVAMNTPPPVEDEMSPPPPPMPDEAPMVPPPATGQLNEPPPPPPPAFESQPPMVAEAPPAPMEPPAMADMQGQTENPLNDFLGEGDQASALLIGAILLIMAVALFIIIRKRKARRNIDFHTATHTQIE